MPKHPSSPSREERAAAKDKRAKRAQARDPKKRGRVPSSSSEDENEPDHQNTQPPRRCSPRTAPAPAPPAAPAPAPAAAPAAAPATEVIIPKEYNPPALTKEWLVSAGRPEEAALVVDPFRDHPPPPLNAPWAQCGFAPGWKPGQGWRAIPAWLRVRHEHQGFDPTNPASVRKLEKEFAICKEGNVRPFCPFSMLSPTSFETSLLRRAEVATDPTRAAQLERCQAALNYLRGRCETAANPGAEDRARYGCCQSCAFQTTLLLRVVGPEAIMRVTGNDYAQVRLVRGRLVDGKVVLENLAEHDAALINDHLEWYCNQCVIPAFDVQDDGSVDGLLERSFLHCMNQVGGIRLS